MGMLILTRVPGDTLTIKTPNNEEIVIAYLPHPDGISHGRQIRLGISAPRAYQIFRKEARDRWSCPQHRLPDALCSACMANGPKARSGTE